MKALKCLLIYFLIISICSFNGAQASIQGDNNSILISDDHSDDNEKILDSRIQFRKKKGNKGIKRRGANIAISGPEELTKRKVARRSKGAFALDLNNNVAYMKLSKKVGDFSEALKFLPPNFLAENPDGSRSVSVIDDLGNEIVISARNGTPVFIIDGVEQSLLGSVGPKGDPGGQGPVGPVGGLGPAGGAGPTGPAGGVFGTTGIITSNESGSPGSYTNNDLVFGSPSLLDDADANHDSRMFFDKSLGAFGAGIANGTQWDSPGMASAVFGTNNIVAAPNSVSFGTNNTINVGAQRSFAAGDANTTSGQNSFVAGNNNVINAGGFASGAIGSNHVINGSSAFAAGTGNTVNSSESASIGQSNISEGGSGAFTMGRFLHSNAGNAISIGSGIDALNRMLNATANSFAVGFNSTVPTFFVGPGAGAGTVGNVGIGINASAAARNLHVNDTLRIEPRGSAPGGAAQGDIYVDSTNGAFCFFDGTVWQVAAGTGPCA